MRQIIASFVVAATVGAMLWAGLPAQPYASFAGDDWSGPLYFSRDSKTLAVVQYHAGGTTVNLLDIPSGKNTHLCEPEGVLDSFVFSPDLRRRKASTSDGGQYVAVSLRYSNVTLLDRTKGQLVADFRGAKTATFSPDSKTLAVADESGTIRLYKLPLERPWVTIMAWAATVFVGALVLSKAAKLMSRRKVVS